MQACASDIGPGAEARPSRERLRRLIGSRKPGHALPGAFYTDPDIFATDIAVIFEREWIFVGASCEIPQPGNFMTVTIGRSPILVLRDRQGVLRAFYNSCRHRGFKLCEAERGHLPAIVCPYHRWTYRLDGSLAHAKFMPEDFRPEDFSLAPVHLRTVGGTIYVCLATEPPDFAPYQAAMTEQLAPHGLENAKLAHEDHLIEYGNWKMAMENSRECYHCASGHDELMRTFLDIYDFANPEQNALIGDYWNKWEAAGFTAQIAEGAHYRASRLPFTANARSITMDGHPAVAKPLGQSPADAYGSLRWVHYPSTFNHCLNDYTVLVRMLPIGPEETLVTTKWLVNAEAIEGVDYTIENLTQVWQVTNQQDKVLVERNQAGVRSSGYRPGPYSPAVEAGVLKFVDWYCGKIGAHADAAVREGALS
ncbi:aromatic ring-hydroxylating dioxygenase subunit alpha [Acidisoma cellulosilytica]|uniref:Aromatic ring-hydroxylating dioxygenase subunit alpha n=1 Tax=Acidisoma cellulosilyticum TaxID=2802395 RepID=A0A963Z5B6_9PROT|nr:aromatic ring-hydroxylating dioxygenase subunit alpha [Acidisoma cellulosilyticum]MCB8883114.1 aromatic ring-hydroxylating dioxygenase subunit alpha [Acidisoma cellulosilyticum]